MGNRSGLPGCSRPQRAAVSAARSRPVTNAIVGINLADAKQVVAVTDHDTKVLARKTFGCRSWDLGAALDWAAGRAAANGWAGVTVSNEPTGTGGGCSLSWLQTGRCRSGACTDGHLVVAAHRGSDRRQDRREGRSADRPGDDISAVRARRSRAGRPSTTCALPPKTSVSSSTTTRPPRYTRIRHDTMLLRRTDI